MPERILQDVLSGQLHLERLLSWLRGENIEGGGEDCPLRGCGRSEFAAFILSYVHNQTDRLLQSSAVRSVVTASTPERSGRGGRVHRRSVSDPTAEPATPVNEHKHKGRKVKTKLFTEDRSRDSTKEPSSDESQLSTGVNRLILSSTPVRDGSPKVPDWGSPADSPRSRSHRAPDTTLGDFLASAQKSSKKKKSKNTSDDSDTKVELDLSNAEAFPEIGARKASSLRAERRRIKPTNIDLSKKSISLNSFNSEEFQRSSPLALEDNIAFTKSPGAESTNSGFSAERAVLKRERRRLIEKFQSISAATSPRVATPTFKLTPPPDKVGEYVIPDLTKVTFEEKLETLAKIYDSLLENNLIFTYTNELYFLMSLVLARTEENTPLVTAENLLTSVHNCGYFGARVLWLQRTVLIQLLDESSLRALGEAKSVRALAPDLAKCLLNAYGVRRESGGDLPPPKSVGGTGGVVQWNTDTDNADNFPSTMAFQCFKKQRDMFYEIVRWYWASGCGGGSEAGCGPSLRARVRALLAAGPPPCASAHAPAHGTYPHIGLLVGRHAKASALGGSGTEDSRLSKLQRRFTKPARVDSLFTAEEELYRELLSCTESEPFRAHVRDALATELIALDEGNITGGNLYHTVRAARSLGKLLGMLAALPYSSPSHSQNEAQLRHTLAPRTYWVPPLDLIGAVSQSAARGRLTVTLPWVAGWLAAVDYTTPRLPYFTRLLRILRAIQLRRLAPSVTKVAATNKLFIKCVLSWLFARPHIPQEVLYDEESEADAEATAIADKCPEGGGADGTDLLTIHELGSLLSVRREAALVLSGAGAGAGVGRVGGGAGAGAGGGEGRHVTPLRIAPSRDHHLQRRLAAALRTSVGGGARRVLEVCAERVGARALQELATAAGQHTATDHKCTQEQISAITSIGPSAMARLSTGVTALWGGGGGGGGAMALAALAGRAVRARLAKHAHQHLQPGALCPEAAAAVRALIAGGWGAHGTAPATAPAPAPAPQPPLSVAEALIHLKEVVCQALEGGVCASEAASTLRRVDKCAGAAGRGAKRALVMLSVDLCVAIACKRPKELTEEVLQSAEKVWVSCCGPRVGAPRSAPPPVAPPPPVSPPRGDRAPTPHSDEEVTGGAPIKFVIAPSTPASNHNASTMSNTTLDTSFGSTNGPCTAAPPESEEELLEIFPRAASVRNIRLLANDSECRSIEAGAALGGLLAWLAARGWVSPRELTERCVALYRAEWPQSTLGALSACIRAVSAAVGEGPEPLLLDFLAEYCADMQPTEDLTDFE